MLGILRPILSIVESKKPGDDDRYIESLAEYSADIVPIVYSNIWTAKKLSLVPQEYLKEKFLSLDMEQKLSVLVGFKDIHSDELLGFVTDPKLKIILSDKMKNFSTLGSDFIANSYKTSRSFLNDLKDEHEKGEFELQEVA